METAWLSHSTEETNDPSHGRKELAWDSGDDLAEIGGPWRFRREPTDPREFGRWPGGVRPSVHNYSKEIAISVGPKSSHRIGEAAGSITAIWAFSSERRGGRQRKRTGAGTAEKGHSPRRSHQQQIGQAGCFVEEPRIVNEDRPDPCVLLSPGAISIPVFLSGQRRLRPNRTRI